MLDGRFVVQRIVALSMSPSGDSLLVFSMILAPASDIRHLTDKEGKGVAD